MIKELTLFELPEDYNEYCCYYEKEKLTQEEYELLKEILL